MFSVYPSPLRRSIPAGPEDFSVGTVREPPLLPVPKALVNCIGSILDTRQQNAEYPLL